MIVIAARPAMGKTAFVLSMARNTAVEYGMGVAIFSLEMSSVQLVKRLIASETRLKAEKLRKGDLREHEFQQLHSRITKLATAPIFIDDTPGISVFDLRAKCRRLKMQHDIQMIIIDYLQLMRSGLNIPNREQEIAEISRGLKGLAKELNIPVIALSQLSRNVEQRGGSKTPMLSDLRDSGQIEQDADMVLFCYRPEYYHLSEYDWFGINLQTENLFMLIVAKHRNGVLGEIPLNFYGEFTQIDNHKDNYMLYPNEKNSSKIIPVEAINSSKLIPEIITNSSNIMPININFDNEKGSAILPPNNINDSMRLPYKENNDISDLLDNPPF
jgi:replicative DNA helicase